MRFWPRKKLSNPDITGPDRSSPEACIRGFSADDRADSPYHEIVASDRAPDRAPDARLRLRLAASGSQSTFDRDNIGIIARDHLGNALEIAVCVDDLVFDHGTDFIAWLGGRDETLAFRQDFCIDPFPDGDTSVFPFRDGVAHG